MNLKKSFLYLGYMVAIICLLILSPIFFGLLILYLFVVPLIIAIFAFNKLSRKKSFEQVYKELYIKETTGGKISVINYILSYVQKYTFEELIIYNLKCCGIRYYPYCYYLFPSLFSITLCFMWVMGTALFAFSQKEIIFRGFYILFLLGPILLTLFQIIVFKVINQKTGITNSSWKNLGIRLCYNVIEIIFISFILSYTLIYLLILIAQQVFSINDIMTNITTLSCFFNYLNIVLIYISKLFIYLLKFNIISVHGNQLSLAGFYFALAISGMIIFSIIDRYFKKEEILKEKMLKRANEFNELYSEYKLYSTSLDLTNILSVNYANLNFRKFKLKKDIIFNNESIKSFETLLLQLQTKLSCEEIRNERIILNRFKFFNRLIVLTYLMGIVTIFVPENLTTVFLWIFIINSFCFGVLIAKIYNDYIR